MRALAIAATVMLLSACGSATPSASNAADTTAAAPDVTSAAAQTTDEQTSDTASAPSDTPTPAVDHAAGAAAAAKACSTFAANVLPPINANVQAGDLAPLIRLQMGEPLNGGAVDVNAPWFVTNNDAGEAASDDPAYQPLDDALSALGHAIIHADPSGDLSGISSAADAVTTTCATLKAG